jgi:Carbohydrate family 9 binding domain-like
MDKNTYIALGIALATLIFVIAQPSLEKAPLAAATGKAALDAAYGSPLIDGVADDPVWQNTAWQALDQVWVGATPAPTDFSGRYKVCWDENNLYLLAEIIDDTLVDTHSDPLFHYWDDDCLEIFLDEDASGGEHQYNYNAFAYHIALDGKVADIDPNKNIRLYDHCSIKRSLNKNLSTWEVAIRVFDGKNYSDDGDNTPKMLQSGKKMGFALAYCDNDHSAEREHFIGSVPVAGEDKNRGWIDAGIFGLLRLAE